MHEPDRDAREALLAHSEATVKVILERTEHAIDSRLGQYYARKNPLLLQSFARIFYDEYVLTRDAVKKQGSGA